MKKILNDNNNQVVYYVEAGGKRFGPFLSDTIAGAQLGVLPLTEDERMTARIVPSTTDGKQILMET